MNRRLQFLAQLREQDEEAYIMQLNFNVVGDNLFGPVGEEKAKLRKQGLNPGIMKGGNGVKLAKDNQNIEERLVQQRETKATVGIGSKNNNKRH